MHTAIIITFGLALLALMLFIGEKIGFSRQTLTYSFVVLWLALTVINGAIYSKDVSSFSSGTSAVVTQLSQSGNGCQKVPCLLTSCRSFTPSIRGHPRLLTATNRAKETR